LLSFKINYINFITDININRRRLAPEETPTIYGNRKLIAVPRRAGTVDTTLSELNLVQNCKNIIYLRLILI
jgi:hypothetical protein